MEYPRNGSIVIVDDKPEEVEGLIRVLASKSIPTMYFNEEIDKIPSINGVRIIFLDLDLKIGVQDNPERTIISNAFAVLNKLILSNNGGYILVLWSTLIENHGEAVKAAIIKAKEDGVTVLKEYPIDIILLDKTEVSTKNGKILDFNIKALEGKINSMVPDNNILNLINHWENSVSDASKKVMSNFDSIAKLDTEKKELLSLFADSIYQTSNLNTDNILNPALSPLSALLLDQLSSYQDISKLPEISRELITHLTTIGTNKKKILAVKQVADINTFYHVDSLNEEHFAPGSVYNYDKYMDSYSCSSDKCNREWAKNLKEPMMADLKIKVDKYIKSEQPCEQYNVKDTERKEKQEEIKSDVIPIFLEFTPDCDYVQGRRKKLRLIFGLMFPIDDGIDIDTNKKDFYIKLPLINYKDKQYNVLLNLLTVTGINQTNFSDVKSIFRFRKELLVDIQQKIASHISRPGFFNMNDYLIK